MEKQFDDVSAKHGAPMGRPEFGCAPKRDIELFEVRLVDGDYDDGGAYWGGKPSEPLFCARGEGYQKFVRAADRVAAASILHLDSDQLLVPLDEAQLESVLHHYAVCALWSTNDESGETGGLPLDESYDVDDIHPDTMTEMREDCADFLRANQADVQLAMKRDGYTEASVGHDFWLTRNSHGAGFWDRGLGEVGQRLTKAAKIYGSVDLWVDEDGKVRN